MGVGVGVAEHGQPQGAPAALQGGSEAVTSAVTSALLLQPEDTFTEDEEVCLYKCAYLFLSSCSVDSYLIVGFH